MRTLFAVSLIALLLGVGVVALIETDPGYILVSHGNYTLESSLWVGLLVLGLVLFVIYQLLRIVYGLISGRRTLANWWGSRQTSHALKSTTRGFVSFIEGNWGRARRQLLRGTQNNEAAFVNYVLAARASDQLEEPEQVAEYLRSAGDIDSDAGVALDIVRAEQKLRAGDLDQSLAILQRVRAGAGRYPRALALLREVYEGIGDWDAILELLPDLLKQKVITLEEARALERDLQRRRLMAPRNVDDLHSVWGSIPSEVKEENELQRLYVARQIDLGDEDAAEKSILRVLKKHWDPELVRQYGLIERGDASARLRRAERWLPEHSEDPELLLCLGRLCLRDRLWGKARDYFESCYRVRPTAEICAELGRLLVGLGEPKVAAAYYREGLTTTTAGIPDLPMPEKALLPGETLEKAVN